MPMHSSDWIVDSNPMGRLLLGRANVSGAELAEAGITSVTVDPPEDEKLRQRIPVADVETIRFVDEIRAMPAEIRGEVETIRDLLGGVIFFEVDDFAATPKGREPVREEPTDETNPKDRLGIRKPRIHLIPAAALLHEAGAMGNGSDKYGPYNWRRKKVKATIYVDATMRHVLAWLDGEEVAEDSGVHHLGHARACLGILLDALESGNLVDDRPAKGPAAALITRLTSSA